MRREVTGIQFQRRKEVLDGNDGNDGIRNRSTSLCSAEDNKKAAETEKSLYKNATFVPKEQHDLGIL